jgi:hypothetical protein
MELNYQNAGLAVSQVVEETAYDENETGLYHPEL